MNIRFLFIFLVFASLNAFADKWVGITKQEPCSAKIQLINSDSKGITITFNIEGFNQLDVVTDSGIYSSISLPGATTILEKAAPDLAKLATSIIIPDTIGGNIEVLSSDYTDYQEVKIAPSKGNLYRDIDPDKVNYEFGDVYRKNDFYPGNLASLEKPYVFRDYIGQTAIINPFQYNPVAKILRVYHSITVRVTFNSNNQPQEKSLSSTSNDFKTIYKNHFLNYIEPRYTALSEEGNMLIICYGPYMDAMKPFVEWKKSIGVNVEMVDISAIGNDETSINNYVANYYNKTKKISHLLLVGDHQQVNTNQISTSGGSGFSDNIYGYILGYDSYPEVIVGRFSAESVADVETQVERTINYERNPINSAGLNHIISIGSNIGGNGQGDNDEADWQHQRLMREKLLGYTYLDGHELYDGDHYGQDKSGNPNAEMVGDAINDGAGLLLYTGHGTRDAFLTSMFSSDDVNSLSNSNCLPFILSVACLNGQFAFEKCFAENWLRATNNNGKPIGAVATIMSTINQSWDPPMCAQDEMVNIITETDIANKKFTFGGIAINGMLKMLDNYKRDGGEIIDTWTIFGDPSLMIRTDEALPIIAACPSSVYTDETKVEISCNVENAKVCLTKDGEIIGLAVVSGGKAIVNISNTSTIGNINVVITSFNRVPFIDTISIVADLNRPNVVLKSTVISDETGNKNQKADISEEIDLEITFYNPSNSENKGLVATLSSKDSILSVVSNLYTIGDIAAKEERLISNCFRLKIADKSVDQYAGILNLNIVNADGDEWNYPISIVIQAPDIAIGSKIVVNDSVGNNDRVLDKEEQVSLIIPYINKGGCDLKSAKAILACTSQYVTINNPIIELDTITVNQLSEATFDISIASGSPEDLKVDFEFTIEGAEYSKKYEFYKFIGSVFEDFETQTMMLPTWDFTKGNKPWAITESDAYEGKYSLKSGDINDLQESVLTANTYVKKAGPISFYYKISCQNEVNNAIFDYLEFKVDNVSIKKWAGSNDWTSFSYNVSSGSHSFTWTYKKDYLLSNGLDCAWIDNVKFPLLINNPEFIDLTENEIVVYPNPVTNNTVTLNLTLAKNDLISIALYNSTGQKVMTFADNLSVAQGFYTNEFNIEDLPQGLYYMTVSTSKTIMSKKLFVPRLK